MRIDLVMLDVEGLCLTEPEKKTLQRPGVGGVILFARNYESPEQVSALINEIRAHCRDAVLIAVDQEGGRVQRFRDGMTRLPAAACYADGYREDPAQALDLVESAGWLMASELLSLGVDFSFAPVLDVDCGLSEVIGNRAFSNQPDIVTEMALAFRAGMNRAGMAAVGKHFPGHGGVAADSHLTLPEDDRTLEQLMKKDVLPFQKLIAAGLEGIMLAHVVYPRVDDRPAGFSGYWIEAVLRRQLGFAGAVFSDDLSMQGAACAGDFVDRARSALDAGCDMLLVCNQPGAAEDVLAALPQLEQGVAARQQRLLNMRARQGVDRSTLLRSKAWQDVADKLSRWVDRAG